MRASSILINVARGEVIDEAALAARLKGRRLAGVGIDVYENEPPEEWSLVNHPGVVATPHIGATTAEAQSVVAEMVARQIGRYLIEGEVIHGLNQSGSS